MTVTLEKIKQKLTELEAMIKAYEEQAEAEFPKAGDTYYAINSNGLIHPEIYELAYDEEAYSIGNCFRTQEEAEFAAEQLKVIAEMKRCGGVWKTKRDNGTVFKIHIIYTHPARKEYSVTYSSCMTLYTTPEMYFPTKEAVQKAIDTIGEERLLKYWFCVEVKHEQDQL